MSCSNNKKCGERDSPVKVSRYTSGKADGDDRVSHGLFEDETNLEASERPSSDHSPVTFYIESESSRVSTHFMSPNIKWKSNKNRMS